MILCCGEALIDMLPAQTPEGAPEGAQGFVPHCGGAVMNTAVALGRLGSRAGLFAGLSDDIFGRQITEHLLASHVDLTTVARSTRNTTLAFVHLEEGHADYAFFDENSAGRMLGLSDLPQVAQQVTTLFFGGISLAVEPAAETFATLLERESEARVIMMDPNIREQFIPDETRYRDRLKRLIAKTDIIKVSDEDLNWLIPTPLPMEGKIRLLLAAGPSIVAMTKGAEGATAYLSGGAVVSVSAEPVDVADTVGAGDTFNAGFLHKLNELGYLDVHAFKSLPTEAVEQALAFGSKVAGISVTRRGANPPWAHEIS